MLVVFSCPITQWYRLNPFSLSIALLVFENVALSRPPCPPTLASYLYRGMCLGLDFCDASRPASLLLHSKTSLLILTKPWMTYPSLLSREWAKLDSFKYASIKKPLQCHASSMAWNISNQFCLPPFFKFTFNCTRSWWSIFAKRCIFTRADTQAQLYSFAHVSLATWWILGPTLILLFS